MAVFMGHWTVRGPRTTPRHLCQIASGSGVRRGSYWQCCPPVATPNGVRTGSIVIVPRSDPAPARTPGVETVASGLLDSWAYRIDEVAPHRLDLPTVEC